MVPVLYAPVRTDGAAQDLGAVTGLTRIVSDLLARGPQAGAGVLDVGQARDPGDAADQRLPGCVQKACGVEHLDVAMLLAAMAASPKPKGFAAGSTVSKLSKGQPAAQTPARAACRVGWLSLTRTTMALPVAAACANASFWQCSASAVNSTPVRPSSAISFGTAAISSGAPPSS